MLPFHGILHHNDANPPIYIWSSVDLVKLASMPPSRGNLWDKKGTTERECNEYLLYPWWRSHHWGEGEAGCWVYTMAAHPGALRHQGPGWLGEPTASPQIPPRNARHAHAGGEFLLPAWAGGSWKTLRILLSELMGIKYLSVWVQMCLIQIVIFLFAASLSMMNDGSQRSGVINGSTLAPLHALLILLLYYSYNPAACLALPTSRFLGEGLLPRNPIYGEGECGIFLP